MGLRLKGHSHTIVIQDVRVPAHGAGTPLKAIGSTLDSCGFTLANSLSTFAQRSLELRSHMGRRFWGDERFSSSRRSWWPLTLRTSRSHWDLVSACDLSLSITDRFLRLVPPAVGRGALWVRWWSSLLLFAGRYSYVHSRSLFKSLRSRSSNSPSSMTKSHSPLGTS